MTKYEAIVELMRESNANRGSTTAARRAVKAAKVLGLDGEDTIRLLGWLDYCDREGNPYGNSKRVW